MYIQAQDKQTAPVQSYVVELKALQKHFKEQNKEDVRLVFEFCEYDLRAAFKVLMAATSVNEKNGAELVKQLVARPDRSE